MSEMKIRFFTISDYAEEEAWLRDMHKKGLKLVKMTIPCFYFFEKCEPEDVVYRLDYKNGTENSAYKQMFLDYGWEYFQQCAGWLYFRKPASQMESAEEEEIFSDNESKLDMIGHVIKTRMLPLLVIFFCCVVPQLARVFTVSSPDGSDVFFRVFFCVMFVLYLYLLVHCGLKLKKIRKSLERV
ncbi:MAG: DUF2812 domain-containing protein [Clostridiales bacterium]|nr:DUF2812 domain-containing protein [Candidatus Blautia equi]